MKLILAALLLTSFTAQASPVMNTKERLRIHLWVFGLEDGDKPVEKKVQDKDSKQLPEELERALKKV